MFALIECRNCKGSGEFTRKRGDQVACTGCKGTGVYQMVEIAEDKASLFTHGTYINVKSGSAIKRARVYDPIADILTSA